MTFVHIGSYVELPNGKELNNFGETVELSPEEGYGHIVNDVPLLPMQEFEQAGFTADELKKYPNIPMHEIGGPEVVAKCQKAWQLLHDFREALRHPAPEQPEQPEQNAERGEQEGN